MANCAVATYVLTCAAELPEIAPMVALETETLAGGGLFLDVREEVQQMSELVNELLSFSKAGLQPRRIPLSPVTISEVVARVVAREMNLDP